MIFDTKMAKKIELYEVQSFTPYLKVHGHGQTHSHNFCRFKLDI